MRWGTTAISTRPSRAGRARRKRRSSPAPRASSPTSPARRPIGYRAPLYEITAETTDLLRKHGFLYASNLLDTLWPYLHPGAPPLVELPVQWLLDDGPFFAFGLRPPIYRQIFPPSAVLSAWKDEFRGMHALGGAYTLIMHPQYIGRPSRLLMLQELIDYMRTFPGVWFTHGAELARHAASEAAGAGTDGRPLPDGPPAYSRKSQKTRAPMTDDNRPLSLPGRGPG